MTTMSAYTRTALACGCALVTVPVEHRPGCMCGKPEHPPRVERLYCGEHGRKNGETDAAYDGYLDN